MLFQKQNRSNLRNRRFNLSYGTTYRNIRKPCTESNARLTATQCAWRTRHKMVFPEQSSTDPHGSDTRSRCKGHTGPLRFASGQNRCEQCPEANGKALAHHPASRLRTLIRDGIWATDAGLRKTSSGAWMPPMNRKNMIAYLMDYVNTPPKACLSLIWCSSTGLCFEAFATYKETENWYSTKAKMRG